MSSYSEDKKNALKNNYPVGTRVEMLYCSDIYHPVQSGELGTVSFVDDASTIHVNWDSGSSLGIIVGEDRFRKI